MPLHAPKYPAASTCFGRVDALAQLPTCQYCQYFYNETDICTNTVSSSSAVCHCLSHSLWMEEEAALQTNKISTCGLHPNALSLWNHSHLTTWVQAGLRDTCGLRRSSTNTGVRLHSAEMYYRVTLCWIFSCYHILCCL